MPGYAPHSVVCELVPVPERGRGHQDGVARDAPFSETTMTGDDDCVSRGGYQPRMGEMAVDMQLVNDPRALRGGQKEGFGGDLRSLFLIRVLPTDFEGSEMAKKAMQVTGIPEDFKLTEKTISWVNEKFPTVNIEGTLERFVESAQAHGRMYADWQAAFKTWVRKAIENKWDGVEFKQGRSQDPKWVPVLNEVQPYGFRPPYPMETPDGYRTSFEIWKRKQNVDKSPSRAPVIEFGNLLKKAP